MIYWIYVLRLKRALHCFLTTAGYHPFLFVYHWWVSMDCTLKEPLRLWSPWGFEGIIYQTSSIHYTLDFSSFLWITGCPIGWMLPNLQWRSRPWFKNGIPPWMAVSIVLKNSPLCGQPVMLINLPWKQDDFLGSPQWPPIVLSAEGKIQLHLWLLATALDNVIIYGISGENSCSMGILLYLDSVLEFTLHRCY